MNWWIILVAVLFSAVMIFSIIRYIRTPLSFKAKFTFVSLRIIITLLLIIAFFEPSFHFQRVSSTQNDIPVLVDASMSMSLFQPESTVIPFLRKLLQANNNSGSKSRKYQFFLFGDSLRNMDHLDQLLFTDNLSKFPLSQNKHINAASELIVVSDANWSNAFPLDAFADKNIRYLHLPRFKHAPFLNIVNTEISNSPSDSPAVLLLTIEGRMDKQNPVVINITEAGKNISKQTVNENEGYFKRTLKIKLPSATPGKHLYRFSATHSDSVHTSTFNIRYARPQNFYYGLHSLSPSLDRRFITLALSKHPEFVKSEIVNDRKTDCMFFFSWNDSIKYFLKNLKPNGISVFIGCLPCSSKTITPIDSRFLHIESDQSEPMDNLVLEKLPPPSKVISCSELSIKAPILSMMLHNNGKKDTIHLLFNTEWQGYQTLALAAVDFWRWDFWPMSIEYSEEQAFSFSELFVTTVKEQLMSRISEQYYIYPHNTTAESDSLQLSVSFPSTIPVACKSDISVTIKNGEGKTVLDSIVEIINTGSLNQKFTLTPLPTGTYTLTSTISGNQKKYSFSDLLFIEGRHSELHIPGQNSLLLSEIGQAVSLNDSTALFQDLTTENSRSELLIEDSFQLSRTWLLLTAILALLGVEWMYRRFTGLD